ncbi:MAG: endonuclease [Candidatus Cloacimonadota bacterium]|nr:endonuclease [Candidatus Cloacimonadota bacterium]
MIRTKYFLFFLIVFCAISQLQADPPSGYYDPTSGLSGVELRAALLEIISTNTNTNYSNSKEMMYSSIDNIDDTVRCVYSGYSVEHTVGNPSTPAEFSCEHSYCQSWIDSEIVGIENNRAKADLHHLFPVKLPVNIARSNYPFDIVQYFTNSYTEDGGNTVSYLGINQNNSVVFEPDEQHKGNLARALLYFIVRYESCLTFGNVEMLETLLEWHYEDSVNSTEIDRNDAIYDFQTNRNPFIDHPEFVEEIWVGEPSIYVTFPNQTIVLGTSLDYTITWFSQYVYQNVKIELINQNSGGTTELISSTEDDGEWEWTNLENIEPNNDYRIRISDISNSNIFDKCDHDFSIILTDPQSDLFISEYGEGSGYNKYIEIYNGTGACVDFSGYALKIYYNGNTNPQNTIEFSGLIQKDELFIIANPSSCPEIFAIADWVFGGLNFNGNDAVALYQESELIDIMGNIGQDPGDGWNVSGIPHATRNHTLVRKELISSGNPDWENSAGTNSTDSEWLVYNCDTFDYLGSHIMNIPLGAPENVALTSDGVNITITWNPVIRAEIYHVYSSFNPYNAFEIIHTTSNTTFIDAGASSETKHFYYITSE